MPHLNFAVNTECEMEKKCLHRIIQRFSYFCSLSFHSIHCPMAKTVSNDMSEYSLVGYRLWILKATTHLHNRLFQQSVGFSGARFFGLTSKVRFFHQQRKPRRKQQRTWINNFWNDIKQPSHFSSPFLKLQILFATFFPFSIFSPLVLDFPQGNCSASHASQ